MPKKVFITGGSGFLGRNLITFLKNKKIKIFAPSSKEVNLLKYEHLRKIKNDFDIIYHLAAWTQAGDFCLKYPMDQWIINQEINSNMIKWWSLNGNKNSKIIILEQVVVMMKRDLLKKKIILMKSPMTVLQLMQ